MTTRGLFHPKELRRKRGWQHGKVKHWKAWLRPGRSGRTASAGFRSPEPGWRSRATPVLALWRSRCSARGLRQAGRVAARPAAGCSRLQSFICCGPTVPQVWTGMSSAGLKARRVGTDGTHGVRPLLGNERSKGKRQNPFHGRGGQPKADLVGFWVEQDAAGRKPKPESCFQRNVASQTTVSPKTSIGGIAASYLPDQKIWDASWRGCAS